ncbi:MAG: NAD(P)/FAD-dependent oxidoreductase [Ostreibacterium sp.]
MLTDYCNNYYDNSLNDDNHYPQLEGHYRVDVAIVGGGLTAVATAVELSEKGLKVAIIEAKRIGWGATGRNGGQVTSSLSGDKAILKRMRPKMGAAADDFLWHLRWHGHDIIKNRIEQYKIDCDLKFGHIHTAYKPSHMHELAENHTQALARGMEQDVTLVEAKDMQNYLESNLYHGGLINNRNMHLHSLNLCRGEAKAAHDQGALIFENSTVIDIKHRNVPAVITEFGQVSANAVIVAGNAYHRLGGGKMQGMIFPACGANVTTVPLSDEVADKINPHDLAVYDCRFVLDYYRLTADKRLMFGGGSHYSGREFSDIESELRPSIEKTFPRLKGVEIEYAWSGMMGIVMNRIPQIGKLSDHVFYAQGYSGHGIALSHIIAEIMADAMTGSLEQFDTFASIKHIRLPFGEWANGQMMAAGMWYYNMLEKYR